MVIGNTLTLTEEGTGSTNVIITASDGVLEVMDTFLVTIKNNSPRVANPLTDLTLREGFGTHDLDIANTFKDERSLMFSVRVDFCGAAKCRGYWEYAYAHGKRYRLNQRHHNSE